MVFLALIPFLIQWYFWMCVCAVTVNRHIKYVEQKCFILDLGIFALPWTTGILHFWFTFRIKRVDGSVFTCQHLRDFQLYKMCYSVVICKRKLFNTLWKLRKNPPKNSTQIHVNWTSTINRNLLLENYSHNNDNY